MAFTRDKFTLFWSMPPDAQDWANLNISGVRRVMLVSNFAEPALLGQLASLGYRVIFALTEQDMNGSSPAQIAAWVRNRARYCPTDAVILGREPEQTCLFGYGSGDWGQQRAWEHAYKVGAVRAALAGIGPKIISPGWTMRSISEDEEPQPGRIAWRDIVSTEYNRCDGAGLHLYGYNWLGPVDELRWKFALKYGQEMFHRPLWIDEAGVPVGSDVEQMRAYISMARILLNPRHPLGRRVEMFCPFVSNGTGQGWDAAFLLRDPAAYHLLGAFMREG